MTIRGVVISPSLSANSGGFSFHGGVDVDQLKRLLLYWDSLSYMAMGGIGPNLDSLPELSFLHGQGILQIEHVPVPSDVIPTEPVEGAYILGIPVTLYRDVQLEAQMRLAKAKTTVGAIYTVAQFGEGLQLSQLNAKPGKLWEFRLYACLPTPGPDTPIQDILEFRTKNKRELMQLRIALDKMRSDIVGSEDPERTLAQCAEQISFALSEVILALQKAKLPFRLETLKTFLEVQESYLLGAALSALGVAGLASPLSIPAATVAIGASVSLAQRLASGAHKIPESLRDYAYVYRAQREL